MRLIDVQNVSKSFNSLKVLDNVSLVVNSSEKVAIVGPSGVGKSTLLRLIAGLDTPDSGNIKIHTNKISMVFQYSALLNSYSVGENISLALHGKDGNGKGKKMSKEEKEQKITEKLRLVGLERYINYFPDQLSGGQRKRISFARAIASDPEIILYDEPTSGLDPILSTLIENYINRLASEFKVASIVVTHQLSTIKRTAERVIMLCEGKIVWEGNPNDFEKCENPYVKQFVSAKIEGPILTGLLE